MERELRHYAKFSPEQQAAIGKYASLHGNQAAIRPSSIEPGCDLLSARGILANGRVLFGWLLNVHARVQ